MARAGNPQRPLGRGQAANYGVRQQVVREIQAFQAQGGVTEDPLAPLPQPSPRGLTARRGAFVEAFSVFNDMEGTPAGRSKYEHLDATGMGYDTTASSYYERPYVNPADPSEPRYQNQAGQLPGAGPARNRTDAPAAMTITPTATSNPYRPRTVAAGWEPYPDNDAVGKLSVVFRDGTYYNYYDVTEDEWNRFKQADSKGPLLNPKPVPGFLMYKPRGEATVDFMTEQAQEVQYKIARTAQSVYMTDTERRQGLRPGRAGRPRKANSSKAGQNPSKGGKP